MIASKVFRICLISFSGITSFIKGSKFAWFARVGNLWIIFPLNYLRFTSHQRNWNTQKSLEFCRTSFFECKTDPKHRFCQIAKCPGAMAFLYNSKLYIPSTLNTDYLLWHTQLIVCAILNHRVFFSLFKFFAWKIILN